MTIPSCSASGESLTYGTRMAGVCEWPMRLASRMGTMCELLGLSFARPLPADCSIRVFALRGAENADGRGLVWDPDRSLALVKEALDWRESPYLRFLENYQGLRSQIEIAHVRHRMMSGASTLGDTPKAFHTSAQGCPIFIGLPWVAIPETREP